MIGLIQLTGPSGNPFWINPNHIGWFSDNSPEVAQALGVNPAQCTGKGAILVLGATPFQFQEKPNQIINALTRLRQKAEKNALALRNKPVREDWQGDEDFSGEEE